MGEKGISGQIHKLVKLDMVLQRIKSRLGAKPELLHGLAFFYPFLIASESHL